jgi:adenosylhomocysteine nucleosidase
MSLILTFALEQEFAPWRRLRRFEPREVGGERCYHASIAGRSVFITFTGIGARRIEHLNALAEPSKASAAIVTGLAGGLNLRWQPGDVLVAESVCDESGGQSIASDPSLLRWATRSGAKPVPRFVTVPEIVRTAEEKSRLAPLAEAVEMESLMVMKEFARLGIPAVAIRAISDSAVTDLPFDFGNVVDSEGDIQIARLAAQVARRPQNLPGAIRLGRSSRRAARNLAEHLDRFAENWAVQNWPSGKPTLAVAG